MSADRDTAASIREHAHVWTLGYSGQLIDIYVCECGAEKSEPSEMQRVRAMAELYRNQGLRDDEEWKLAGFMAIFHPEIDLEVSRAR